MTASPIYISKEDLGIKGYFNSLTSTVFCVCGNCSDEGNYYDCGICGREIPYCNGCDDEFFDFCNECAAQQVSAKPHDIQD
jgi:hypothetical protein